MAEDWRPTEGSIVELFIERVTDVDTLLLVLALALAPLKECVGRTAIHKENLISSKQFGATDPCNLPTAYVYLF